LLFKLIILLAIQALLWFS